MQLKIKRKFKKIWLSDKESDLIEGLIFNPLLRKLKVNKLENLSYRGILYSKVLARLIDFFIIAFMIFLVIKYMNIEVA